MPYEHTVGQPGVAARPTLGEWLRGAAMGSAQIPVLGDIAGLAADAHMYATEPESRKWSNYLLTAGAALAPVVPAAVLARGTPRGARSGRQAGILGGPRGQTRPSAPAPTVRPSSPLARQEQWMSTGWEMGPDNVPRYEIPDIDAAYLPMGWTRPNPVLGDILDHPRLYEAYPHLYSAQVRRSTDPNMAGSYDPGTGTITLGAGDELDTLVHEVQHAVQQYEGMAKGGSPTVEGYQATMEALERERQGVAPVAVQQHRLTRELDQLKEKQYEILGDVELDTPEFEAMPRHAQERAMEYENRMLEIEEDLMAVMPDAARYAEIDDTIARIHREGLNPAQLYNELLGEIEARAVERSRRMSLGELASTPPSQRYDVPEERIVVTQRRP